jgi:hypothetical protein
VPFRHRKGKEVSSTALVSVAPSDHRAPAGHGISQPRADFLAQLIATTTQAPQTRNRRRAEPDVAIAAYGASERCLPTLAGHELKRWL